MKYIPNLNIPVLKRKYYDIESPEFYVTRFREGNALALMVSEDGQKTNLTVNLHEYGELPPPNHFFVRDYGVDEGLAESLESIGLATKITQVPIGFGSGWLMKFAFDAESMIEVTP